MNLILFKEDEKLGFLNTEDYRAVHILTIIKSKPGDSLDFGIINGDIGELVITSITPNGILFTYKFTRKPPPLLPVTLIIGTPRPPVAKRLLKDLSTAGIKKIIMCATDLGEKTYLTSNLWKDKKYMKYIEDGASQAESTLLPELERNFSLKKALESIRPCCDKLAMDNISPDFKISEYSPEENEVVICIGAERGFSDRERDMLRSFDYSIFKMGERILRTETACHRVLGSVLTTMGLI